MERLLLECAIRAGLIAAATGIVLLAMRIKTASIQHTAWTGVVLMMLLLPIWTVWGPKAEVRVLPVATGTNPMDVAAPAKSLETMLEPAQLKISSARAGMPAWDWTKSFRIVYFLVSSAFLIRLLMGTLQAYLLVRRASWHDGLLTSGYFAAPVTVGLFWPSVILPQNWPDWPAAELDAVMTHEREHARRRDPLVQWLALLNRAIFWFHPLAWWLERRLSWLAEEACDEAVLACGHDPRNYSEYLLEMARTVERTAGRANLAGMAMPGSFLPQRIRRIIEGVSAPPISWQRIVCAAAFSTIAAVAFAACTLDHVSQRAPGQPTMNELMHRRADEQRRLQDKTRQFVDEAKQLTSAQVQALEEKLSIDPRDDESRKKLLTYYQYKPDWRARNRHLLWLLEFEPEASGIGWPYVDTNPTAEYYEQGKRILLAQLEKPGARSEVFGRAAWFVLSRDVQLAEQILLKGRKAYPDEKSLAMQLGGLYAGVLVTHTPFANAVREQLAISNDAYLLTQTAQVLLHYAGRRAIDFDVIGPASSYLNRALSIQPDLHLALVMKAQADLIDEQERFARMTSEERAHASDALRIRILNHQVQDANILGKFNEAGARELL